jgi:hypothetical protein
MLSRFCGFLIGASTEVSPLVQIYSHGIFSEFLAVGLLYAALAGILYVISFFRARHSDEDFADPREDDPLWRRAKPTRGQTGGRIFGRPFITAGWIVLAVATVVAGMEIALFVMIFQV